MEKKVLIIGHIDHGSTIIRSLNLEAQSVHIISPDDKKTIQDIIEEDRTMKIIAPLEAPTLNLTARDYNFKDGKQKRRERRAYKRKK